MMMMVMMTILIFVGTHYVYVQDYGRAVHHFRKNLNCIYSAHKALSMYLPCHQPKPLSSTSTSHQYHHQHHHYCHHLNRNVITKLLATLAQIFNQYFAINQSNITAHEEYATIMESIGRADDAVTHFRECGVLFLAKKKYSDALRFFKRAVGVDNSRCDIWYWYGKTYKEMNELVNTVKYFKMCSFCEGKEAEKANPAGISELYQIIKENGDAIPEKDELLTQLIKKAEKLKK
jgi:tetratricopeptide (TPR) repeat protein